MSSCLQYNILNVHKEEPTRLTKHMIGEISFQLSERFDSYRTSVRKHVDVLPMAPIRIAQNLEHK